MIKREKSEYVGLISRYWMKNYGDYNILYIYIIII